MPSSPGRFFSSLLLFVLLFAGALPPAFAQSRTACAPDVNLDDAVDADDALVLYYAYSLKPVLGTGRGGTGAGTAEGTTAADFRVSIAADASTVVEGFPALFVLTVNKVRPTAFTVTLTLAATGDFEVATGTRTATFEECDTRAMLSIGTRGDEAPEEAGEVTATVLSGDGYAAGASSTASVAITDDDVALSIAASSSPVVEGEPAWFILTASVAPLNLLTVEVVVNAAGDFGVVPGTREVVFEVGVRSAPLRVDTEDDAFDEARGTVTATVEPGLGYMVGGMATAEVTIADDDVAVSIAASSSRVLEGSPAIFVLSTREAPSTAFTVEVVVDATGDFGVATGTREVVFEAGALTATLQVATRGDSVVEPGGTVTATVETGFDHVAGDPATASVSVVDDDVAISITTLVSPVLEGSPVVFILTASEVPSIPLTVKVTLDATGDFEVATGTREVVFEVGKTRGVSASPRNDDVVKTGGAVTGTRASAFGVSRVRGVSATTRNDDVVEPDGAVTATVEPGFGYTVGESPMAKATIMDDDVAISIAAEISSVLEGDTAVFVLTASEAPPTRFTVNVAFNATGDFEVDARPREMVFEVGATTTTLIVETEGDDAVEPGGAVTATVEPGFGYTVGETPAAEVTISDDDVAVSIAPGPSPVVEGSPTWFVLTASEAPPSAFAVDIALSATGDFGVATGTRTLLFEAGEATATLTVATENDDDIRASGTVTATVRAGFGYRVDTTSTTASVTVADDDGGGFRDCADCPELVAVPGGTFTMGSPAADRDRRSNEIPQHEVTIAPFAVGRHEVTFDEWGACHAAGGCARLPGHSGWGRGLRPVIFVSWPEAKEYVAWLSQETGEMYGLLTESQWEYAARAGSTTVRPWGDDIESGHANCNGCGGAWDPPPGGVSRRTAPVGSYAANAFGLHDMLGNVSEWVEDCWHDNYEDAPGDGRARERANGEHCDWRAIRGGSWEDHPSTVRSADRTLITSPDAQFDYIGFRVARRLFPTTGDDGMNEDDVAATSTPASGGDDEAVDESVVVTDTSTPLTAGVFFRECVDCPEMVVVPGGAFTMGSPSGEEGRRRDEGPRHEVTVPRFAVGRREVTFAEWDACHAAGGCARNPSDSRWGRDALPVVNISWDDAKEYVAWLSRETGEEYRLLTESEWEYAARAGTDTAWHWGDAIGSGHAHCAGCDSRLDNSRTAPVGSFAPNAFGLHDMPGNVWEWVEDCWHPGYTGAPTDGRAWGSTNGGRCDWRVYRGGAWSSVAAHVRSAVRTWANTWNRGNILGLRVARTLPATGGEDVAVSIVASSSPVPEGSAAQFILTASEAPPAAFAVNVALSSTGDFGVELRPRTAVFEAGATTTTLIIDSEDDEVDERDGAVTAQVRAGFGYAVGAPATASVTIADDDVGISLRAFASPVLEGSPAVFVLIANDPPPAALTVNVGIGSTGDFEVATGTRTVVLGVDGVSVLPVAVGDDDVFRAGGTVTARVRPGAGYSVGSSFMAEVAIVDNDVPISIRAEASTVFEGGAAAFVLTAREVPQAAFTVQVELSAELDFGVATGTREVVFGAGDTRATFRVDTEGDDVPETSGTVTATVRPGVGYAVGMPSEVQVTIADDDGGAFRDCAHCPEMVVVPGNTYTMGSPSGEEGRRADEGPRHEVSIPRFAAGRHEVTFAEWDACHTAGGCARNPGDEGWDRGNHPAINVNWDDAKEYVAWLSRETGEEYRLLTEAEWEYAARAGTDTAWHWGNAIGSGRAHCAGCDSGLSISRTAPVGSFAPNAFGLHDMSGNVWEWVEDCWHSSYRNAPTDGRAWGSTNGGRCDWRVYRGGGWSSVAAHVRSAVRTWANTWNRGDLLGLRVARTLPATGSDEATVSIAAKSSPVLEGSPAVFILTASEAPPAAFTVQVALGSTGEFGVEPRPRTVVFEAGATTSTLSIDTTGDDVYEAFGTVAATVRAGVGYAIGAPFTASVAIVDDDVAISISAEASPVVEGSPARFILTASEAPQAAFTVQVALSSTGDFGAATGTRTLVFGAGDTRATFRVDTEGDEVPEGSGMVTATVEPGFGYTVGTPPQAQVMLADDDGGAFRDCVHCPEMVVVPGNTFTMGSPTGEEGRRTDEGPRHEVLIPRFAVGRHEVTFAEWDACHAAGECDRNPGDEGWERGNHPAINVDWDDAKEYVAWLSRETGEEYRLLTESEWEYAARAGMDTAWHWGDVIGSGHAHCAGCDSGLSISRTVPVGSFAPNAFGLYDMSGNVWEWVEDCWHSSYRNAPTDGRAWGNTNGGRCDWRVQRGGAWDSVSAHVRSAVRSPSHTGARGNILGLRVARSLPATADDEVTVSIAAKSSSVPEGSPAVFILTAGEAAPAAFTVQVVLSATGEFGVDLRPREVVFEAGALTATLSVETQGDDVFEARGTVAATVRAGAGYAIGRPFRRTVRIADDDVAISVRGETSPVVEGSPAVFVLSASEEPLTAFTVQVALDATGDFEVATGTREVVFRKGRATATLQVDTRGDEVPEGSGTVTATVRAGIGYAVGASSTASVMVVDDDGGGFRECAACPEMVAVPGGTFMMGSPAGQGDEDEHPRHQVTIAHPFAVGRHEVTFAEWNACVNDGGCTPERGDEDWDEDNRPIINVNWNDVQDYVTWLSGEAGATYRLLTESEWEYAARAGTQTSWYWGSDAGSGHANCNGCESSYRAQTAPVGSFAANAFGLHDMLGNVAEWVEDCRHRNYENAPTDGRAWGSANGGDCSKRMLRGGSWINAPEYVRSANRLSGDARNWTNHIGFRVARTLD